MTESILNTIKKMLGIGADYLAFDVDIITHINSAFMVLNQLGVGTEMVFSIEDATAEWADFLEDEATYSAVKTYIYLSVKLVFDPQPYSFINDSLQRQKEELEFRLSVQVSTPQEET